jgi:hypothetical protein
MSIPPNPSRRFAAALAGALLLLAGCSGGENKPILVPTVKAKLSQSLPPASDGVFFDVTAIVGDTIQMNVVVRDSTGALDLDDVDLVLRYDATFIQVVNVTAQDALFGTCNTVNPACRVNSPICVDNLAQANGGGEKYCRSNGSTACITDDDCTATGDKCGSFGRLQAAFAVLTGPKVCTNNPGRTCSASSDCRLCNTNNTLSCTGAGDCSGTCGAGNTCTNIPARSCTGNGDCFDDCVFGTCQGCPSVVVSGTRKIASLTLRVMKEGTSSFRFVVSTNPGTTGSALRKDTQDIVVPKDTFFPNVDGDNPSTIDGDIVVTGTL